MDDTVPLEFDMAIAVRRNDHELQQRLDQAMREQRDALHAILTDYGVPLVKCDNCLISGDLPAHGPYAAPKPEAPSARDAATVSIAQLNGWLAHGADVNVELNNAVMADDQVRVGVPAGQEARARSTATGSAGRDAAASRAHSALTRPMVAFLLAHGADVNQRDRDGWTPLMTGGLSGRCRRTSRCSPSTARTPTPLSRAEFHARSASPRSTARTTPRWR